MAQTYTVQAITAPAYGSVASGTTGNTIFRNTGTVAKQSGNGAWITGPANRATITIRCVNGSGTPANCGTAGNNARVTIGTSGVTSGRALAITDFTVASGTGTVGAGTTTGAGPLDFVFSGFTGTGNLTFFMDTTLPISGDDIGGTTGAATSGFFVRVAKDPIVPSVGLTGLATITVRRSLQVVKVSDLQLGTLVRPSTGSGTVLINNATGARTTGGANPPALVTGPVFGRAVFTISGEPSTTFSITVPASTAITSGANTLTVTLSPTVSGTQTMAVGGTLSLGVGSTTTLTSTQASGSYSGSFTVTIAYN